MIRTLLISVPFLLFLTSCGPDTSTTPPQSQVEAFLDQGGVQYMVVDGQYEWDGVRPIIEYFTKPLSFALRREGMAPPMFADWVEALPTNIGLDEVVQRGTSTITHPQGGYISKTAMERRPDADGVVWKLHGQEFDLRTELNRLPKETAAMFRFTLNASWIVEESKKTASRLMPEAAEGIQQTEAMIAMAGFPLEDALKGLTGGITFALCLNHDETWTIPMSGGMKMPQAGFVLMVDDPDGNLHQTLLQVIQAQIPAPFQPIERTTADVKVHRFLGIPSPIKVIPQLAHANGRLVLTTDDLWMEQVIANAAGDQPSPLLARLEGIEDTRAHQAWVIGENFNAFTSEMSEQAMEMLVAQADDDIPQELIERYMSGIVDLYPHVGICYQGETLSTSVMLHKRAMPASAGGAQSVIVAPAVVGLLAAIAVPSMEKARENAQRAQSLNNLRMIESAKQMWAIEHNKSGSDTPTWEDLSEYLQEQPKCPLGGTYTIGSLDEPPSSSIIGPLR